MWIPQQRIEQPFIVSSFQFSNTSNQFLNITIKNSLGVSDKQIKALLHRLMRPLNSMIFSSSFHTRITSQVNRSMSAADTNTRIRLGSSWTVFVAVAVPHAELISVLQPSCPLIMCRWQHHHLRLTALNAFNTKSFHSFLTNNHFVQDLESKLMWTSQNKEQTPAQHLAGRLSLTGSSVSFLWFTNTPEVLCKHTGCME